MGVVGTAWEAWVGGEVEAVSVDSKGFRYVVLGQPHGKRRVNVQSSQAGLSLPKVGERVRMLCTVFPRVRADGVPFDAVAWLGEWEYVGVPA